MKTEIEMMNDTFSQTDADTAMGKFLTFWTDGQLFGVTISNVEQIVGMQNITSVPDSPSYSKGVISLRGSIIPLIDMRLRLGLKEAAYNDRTCIIISKIHDKLLGFIVDAVDEVASIEPDEITPPPHIGNSIKENYLTGIAQLEGDDKDSTKIVLIVDTQKILGEDEVSALIQANSKNR